jgi:hypothetical protein
VRDLPGDARKWGSVGFTRGSKFATGFSPLAPKSLESIIDVERAKGASSEELSALWNEVQLQSSTLYSEHQNPKTFVSYFEVSILLILYRESGVVKSGLIEVKCTA